MNDYKQPFFVRGSKGKFCGVSPFGYLPPLELPKEEPVIAYADMQWTNRQTYQVQQLKALVLHLQGKYQEQVSERKQSGKLFIQKT